MLQGKKCHAKWQHLISSVAYRICSGF